MDFFTKCKWRTYYRNDPIKYDLRESVSNRRALYTQARPPLAHGGACGKAPSPTPSALVPDLLPSSSRLGSHAEALAAQQKTATSLAARALVHLPSTWPSQRPVKSVRDRSHKACDWRNGTSLLGDWLQSLRGNSWDAPLNARCCTKPAGCHRKRRTAIPLGGPSSWTHALQGFSGMAGAANYGHAHH